MNRLAARTRRYQPAVGPRLRQLLAVVFGLFSLLTVNSVYLVGVRVLEGVTARTYQDWFYLNMFLLHLALGLLIILPVLVFGAVHLRNAYTRPNRRAVRVGIALFTTALVLLATGVVLTRIEGVIVVRDATVRSVAYWLHVLAPLVAAWLFVLHRLAGKRIRWQVGRRWAIAAAGFAGLLVVWHAQDPREWDVAGPKDGERYFFPSLARTASGQFIPAKAMMNDRYCAECHRDTHASWAASVHRFSSFNNPPYLFSVRETRAQALARDGNVQASRFCAGCHDPVVFFSGRFDDPKFDDVADPTAQAGITCSVCHAITHVNSPRGNADYTIEEPIQYPFAFSENRTLRWVNRQLIKAKPELHKKTFLKPLHKTAEFCGTCHKVHLPRELNGYKFLRGQNHYDSFLLSGVSGHGVASFYYPPKASANCADCHMRPRPSQDFGAKHYDDSGELKIRYHQFPSANTAIPTLLKMPAWVNEEHRKFNEGVMRVDLFAVKEGGTIDGELTAPLRPQVPTLVPGRSYLLETVVRTAKMGHHFTQGTTDSNEVWLDIVARAGDRIVGRSGGMDESGAVDPWSHFVNTYVIDREGRRIDRRNAQDIFVPLYNHQIPPGAADVVHYVLRLPAGIREPVTVDVALRYRKFDTTYMRHVYGKDFRNGLPTMTLATDRVVFPVAGGAAADVPPGTEPFPETWQRWNDYGIALLLKGGKSRGELRQAEEAFAAVEALGRADGALNRARLYLEQGEVREKAVEALRRAAAMNPPANSWSIRWFSGLINKQNGYLDEAIADFRSILAVRDPALTARGFDFSLDYRLLNELGQTLVERAKLEHGAGGREARAVRLAEARSLFLRVLTIDPENTVAHYNLSFLAREAGETESAAQHFAAYDKYRVDDNARDRAVAIARRADPAANHAAEAIVLYDLGRPGAYGSSAGGATSP